MRLAREVDRLRTGRQENGEGILDGLRSEQALEKAGHLATAPHRPPLIDRSPI